MAFFRARRQLHRWTAALLFAWVFGLATGIANACIAGTVPDAGEAMAALAERGNEPATDSHAEANCLDFCDKASSSPWNHAADNGGSTVLPAPATWPVAAPGSAAPSWQPVTPDRSGAPPITIAFLRLAL